MANALAPQKTMTLGEGGLALGFAALAFLSIVIAAKAYTPEYAFHAYLFTAASIAAVFAIINRYYERPAGPEPLTIDSKPNYNMGPVKFATVAAMFWGIAGFTVGEADEYRLAGAGHEVPADGSGRGLAHRRQQAHAGHGGQVADHRSHRHLLEQRLAVGDRSGELLKLAVGCGKKRFPLRQLGA